MFFFPQDIFLFVFIFGLKILFEEFGKYGIDTRFIQEIDSHKTGNASILIDENKDNCILVDPGANHRLKFENFKEKFEKYKNSLETKNLIFNIIIQSELKKTEIFKFLAYFNNLEIKIQIFGAVIWPEIILEPSIGQNFLLLSANEVEFEDMMGSIKSSKKIFNQNLPLIIYTKGKKGAEIVHNLEKYPNETELTVIKSITTQEIFKNKIKDLEVLDPTGAGDAFFSYLVGEIIKNRLENDLTGENLEKLKDAVLVANCAGFLNCTKIGACVLPSMEEIRFIISS